MPLLRQALYAQNINLYLAPTADNRDAWLSLMRTIALEGRCFVVSSNMCVRGAPPRKSQTNGHVVVGNSKLAGVPEKQSTGRRSSCLTEDGFEIALPIARPSAPAPAPASPRLQKARRKSIFDEAGNEIVVAFEKEPSTVIESDDDDDEHTNGHPQGPDTLQKATPSASNEFVSRGGSSIISPAGDLLAGPQWEDDEGIIYADVDFDDCIRGRLDLDAAGSYSRYVFRAYFQRTPERSCKLC
jgi:nitrilase